MTTPPMLQRRLPRRLLAPLLLVPLLLVPLLLVAAGPAVAAATDCRQILHQAAAGEAADAAARNASYEGVLTDLESGATKRFSLTAQGGDQLLYVLWDDAGQELSRWGYHLDRAWGYKAQEGVRELDGDSLQSWRLLAVLLSPNRFSTLARETERCELVEPETASSGPLLDLHLTAGGDLRLGLTRAPFHLLRVERVTGEVRRTTVFVGAATVDGEVRFDELRTLRDEIPRALYRFERIAYGPHLADDFSSSDSLPPAGAAGGGAP